MKHIVIILTAAILFIYPDRAAAQPVKNHGNLTVKGTRMVDQNGSVVALNGVSFGWHNWWPRFYHKATVKWLYKDWNCSVVRAAMGVEPEKGYLNSTGWSKKKIEAVIQGAISEDIYVIIDWFGRLKSLLVKDLPGQLRQFVPYILHSIAPFLPGGSAEEPEEAFSSNRPFTTSICGDSYSEAK